jgi:pimeloyl-ACP methyl ester carboxylesterase
MLPVRVLRGLEPGRSFVFFAVLPRPPTLTGLGERAHLMNRAINLDTRVQDIVSVIRCEELSDVVLCGQSYGGMVIAGVAEQIAGRSVR